MSKSVIKSACGECFIYCGALLHVSNGRIEKVEGNPQHPYNRGFLCVKGRRATDRLYHPNRILHPLRKNKTGWARISWDEALDFIATRLDEIINRYGPLSICGATPHTDAFTTGVALCLFLRSLGSPNIMSNSDLCFGAIIAADQLTVGDGETLLRTAGGAAASYHDFQDMKCLFLLGGQIETSWSASWKYFLEAKRRGAKVIVADPRYTKTASHADLYLQVKPGTDGALALGMMNVIIKEGLYDQKFVNQWCFGFDRLRDCVKEYSPEKVEKITWIPAAKITEASRMFALTKPSCLSPRTGAIHHANGVQTARALGCLVAITGNIDIPGGNPMMNYLPGFKSHGSILRDKQFRLPEAVEDQALGAKEFPLWTGPDAKMIGYVHNPTALNAMITEKPYAVKALLLTGVNILNTYPDSRKVMEALKRLEFMVANEWFMTPTAELADLVLPKAHQFETDEIFSLAGMHKGITICQKAVEPAGEAWDDMKFFIELSKRMSEKSAVQSNLLPWASTEDYHRYMLENTGITLEEFKRKGFIPVDQAWRKYMSKGFPTSSGKVELFSTTLEKFGYDPLPYYKELSDSDVSAPSLTRKYPLLVSTSRRLPFSYSRFPVLSWARKIHPKPQVEIHPKTAAERRIEEEDWVWIETPKGKCRFKAVITDKTHPRVVNTTIGWWFPEKPAPEHGCLESNVNAILSYDPPHDPIIGIPTIKGVPCEVTRAVASPDIDSSGE